MMPDDGQPADVRGPFPVIERKHPPAGGAPAPYWQIACRSRDLQGTPRAVTLGGQPLVLFRDAQRAPVALEDRCAHRNAPLSSGRVCGGRLQCRYHGWEYDAAGRVAHIPALPDAVALAKMPRVAQYYTREQDGFVWVAAGDAPPAADPYRFPHLGERGWTSFVMQTRFRSTVEACLENFLDCPHATFVHRYWFRAPTAKPVRATVRATEDGAVAEFFEEPRTRSAVWWLLAPRGGTMEHSDRFIAPATSRVDYRFPGGLHYIISSSCTEVAAGAIDVFTVISFRWGWLGPLVRLYFEPLSRHIIRQDVDILAAQHTNIERFGGPRFRSTAADLLGAHIVAWRQAMAANAPPPAAGPPYDVEIRL
jgi:nitrite reductase/ring-hydroxylating ferredoxin subunit